MKYRAEIDGLRALAVIPVILFHAGFKTFSGGFVGVDIFFVISGYLITTILLNDLKTGSFSIVHFYERRARRILPALFFVMFASLTFAWFWLIPQDMESFSQSLVALSVFASNIFFWRTSGYFDTATEFKPLIHTWSLSVEEQYYVLFPIFLVFVWKLGRRWIVILLSMIAAISLSLAQYYVIRSPSLDFYLLPTRAWELMIGALIAIYYTDHNIQKHKHIHSQIFSLVGVALIAYSIFEYNNKTPFPSIYALVPTIGTALIIVFSTKDTVVGKLLSGKIVVAIGLFSYSAYLWHQPMFAFARHHSLLGDPSTFLMSVLASTSLLLAYLTWRFVERPFRDKHIFDRKQVFIFAITGSVIFSGVGILGILTFGYENRLPITQRDTTIFEKLDSINGSRKSDSSCLNKLGITLVAEEVCLTNSSKPKYLFIGDSHAMALYSSIYAGSINLDALLVSGHSCPTYPNLKYDATPGGYNNCTAIAQAALKISETIPSIDTVVINNYFPFIDSQISRYYFNGKLITNEAAFRIGINHLLLSLFAQKKKVIFVIDVPHLKYNPRLCIQRLPFDRRNLSIKDCAYSKKELDLQRIKYINEIAELKRSHPSLTIFDPTNLFCSDSECNLQKDQKSLYNDTHHISIYASILLVEKMLKPSIVY